MEGPLPLPHSPPRKRQLDQSDNAQPQTPVKAEPQSALSSALSTPMSLPAIEAEDLNSSANAQRHGSPAPSTSTSLSTEPKPTTEDAALAILSGQPAAKRRKLTPQERLEKEHEKRRKAEEKEAKKALKEVEEHEKAEEKRRKAEEREEKKRAKEIEKQQKEMEKQQREKEKEDKKHAKDLEKQQKEEVIQKKENAQLRLSNFFSGVRSAAAPLHPLKGQSPEKTRFISKEDARRKSMSLEPTESRPSSPTSIKREPDIEISEYQKYFLPFSLPTYASLPPPRPKTGQPPISPSHLDDPTSSPVRLVDLTRGLKRKRGQVFPPVKDLMYRLHNETTASTVDLAKRSSLDACEKALHETPVKYLHFGEDVRPPYCGTWTKPVSQRATSHLRSNPCSRAIACINYDEDSEAEWEEPEEGEDLGSEGEEDLEDEEEEDEFGEFLDDANNHAPTRRLLVTKDMTVNSSGVCWEDPRGKAISSDNLQEIAHFADLQMEVLLADPSIRTIDPYSTQYWQKPLNKKAPAPLSPGQTRLPLASSTSSTNKTNIPAPAPIFKASKTTAAKPATAKPSAAKPTAAKRFVDAKDLDEFKRAVGGRTETKANLIPILQQQFKQYPAAVIADTLSNVATRSTMHKKWFLLEMPS